MRTHTVTPLYRPAKKSPRVPYLRMSGQWLAAAGFAIGARITVQVTAGQLIITAR